MNKFHLVVIACLALGACSNTSQTNNKNDAQESYSSFVGGGITIDYDEAGNLTRLESIAVAPVQGSSVSSQELASKIATALARKQVAEFLNSRVQSDSVVETIAQTYQSEYENRQAEQIASKLTETIIVRSEAVLTGLYLAAESYKPESNEVEVKLVFESKFGSITGQ